MAKTLQGWITVFSTFIIVFVSASSSSNVVTEKATNSFVLADGNWTLMLEDEWLVKLYVVSIFLSQMLIDM